MGKAERGFALDGPALKHAVRRGEMIGPGREVVSSGQLERSVEDETDRAIWAVIEEQDHASMEVRVDKSWRGHQ